MCPASVSVDLGRKINDLQKKQTGDTPQHFGLLKHQNARDEGTIVLEHVAQNPERWAPPWPFDSSSSSHLICPGDRRQTEGLRA